MRDSHDSVRVVCFIRRRRVGAGIGHARAVGGDAIYRRIAIRITDLRGLIFKVGVIFQFTAYVVKRSGLPIPPGLDAFGIGAGSRNVGAVRVGHFRDRLWGSSVRNVFLTFDLPKRDGRAATLSGIFVLDLLHRAREAHIIAGADEKAEDLAHVAGPIGVAGVRPIIVV